MKKNATVDEAIANLTRELITLRASKRDAVLTFNRKIKQVEAALQKLSLQDGSALLVDKIEAGRSVKRPSGPSGGGLKAKVK